jgi:hypothetical protein
MLNWFKHTAHVFKLLFSGSLSMTSLKVVSIRLSLIIWEEATAGGNSASSEAEERLLSLGLRVQHKTHLTTAIIRTALYSRCVTSKPADNSTKKPIGAHVIIRDRIYKQTTRRSIRKKIERKGGNSQEPCAHFYRRLKEDAYQRNHFFFFSALTVRANKVSPTIVIGSLPGGHIGVSHKGGGSL